MRNISFKFFLAAIFVWGGIVCGDKGNRPAVRFYNYYFGFVTDDSSAAPIAGATVQLRLIFDRSSVFTLSDTLGFYFLRLSPVPNGELVHIDCLATGYQTESINPPGKPRDSIQVNFALTKNP